MWITLGEDPRWCWWGRGVWGDETGQKSSKSAFVSMLKLRVTGSVTLETCERLWSTHTRCCLRREWVGSFCFLFPFLYWQRIITEVTTPCPLSSHVCGPACQIKCAVTSQGACIRKSLAHRERVRASEGVKDKVMAAYAALLQMSARCIAQMPPGQDSFLSSGIQLLMLQDSF